MTRDELLETSTTLRDAIHEIAELVDELSLPGQSKMNMEELEEEIEELRDVLDGVKECALKAIDDTEEDSDVDMDD